ncbi:MAG: Do family serine endopeptidase [Endomicrobiales bacterium]
MLRLPFTFRRSAVAVAVLSLCVITHPPAVLYGQAETKPGKPSASWKPNPEVLNLQEAFSRVASIIEPTVVNVTTVIEEKIPRYEFFFGSPFEEFFGGQGEVPPGAPPGANPKQGPTRKGEGIASGVIISADGYILTNEHVVHDAKSIRVTLSDQRKFSGKLVGKDSRTDLAVVKIKPDKPLPFARLGDSDKIKVGDFVLAVGSPFGLQQTVTSGIVSAQRQSLEIEGNMYTNLIQTDAAINRGNSGGPLVNISGEVIGINTAIYAPTGVFSGVGFALPINSAKVIMDSLINKGRVVRGWLGVEIRPVDEAIARQFGLPDAGGVLVNNVMDNSPAAKAGLKRGDVIRAVDGKTINSPQELQNVISQTPPKKTVTLQVIRDRKQMNVRLTTGEMPSEEELSKQEQKGAPEEEQAPEEVESAQWQGLQVVTVTPAIAQKFNYPSGEKGCLVVDVTQGSPADEMGARPGDLVRTVNRVPTPDVKAFQAAVKKANLAQGVVMDVDRQGQELYLSYSEKEQKGR